MKKIIYLITKSGYGGAQRYVFDLATALDRQEFEPIVVAGVADQEESRESILFSRLQEKNVRTLEIPGLTRDVGLFQEVKVFWEIFSILKKERPDIVHLNSSKAAGLGALAARLLGIPKIIFTVHGWPQKEERPFLVKKLIHFASWLTVLFSDVVIVVSKIDLTLGERMLFARKKIHYIPVGIKNISFAPPAARELTNPRVVTIGELTPNKGHAVALSAISKLTEDGADLHYTLIGSGESEKPLRSQAEMLGILNRVRFAGFQDDAAKFLKEYDIFLLPSLKEGMPYVLLEAASAGLPIVTTAVIDPGFIKSVSLIEVVPPGNSLELAKALSRTIKNLEKHPAKNHLIGDTYTFEKTFAEIKKLYA